MNDLSIFDKSSKFDKNSTHDIFSNPNLKQDRGDITPPRFTPAELITPKRRHLPRQPVMTLDKFREMHGQKALDELQAKARFTTTEPTSKGLSLPFQARVASSSRPDQAREGRSSKVDSEPKKGHTRTSSMMGYDVDDREPVKVQTTKVKESLEGERDRFSTWR